MIIFLGTENSLSAAAALFLDFSINISAQFHFCFVISFFSESVLRFCYLSRLSPRDLSLAISQFLTRNSLKVISYTFEFNQADQIHNFLTLG